MKKWKSNQNNFNENSLISKLEKYLILKLFKIKKELSFAEAWTLNFEFWIIFVLL